MLDIIELKEFVSRYNKHLVSFWYPLPEVSSDDPLYLDADVLYKKINEEELKSYFSSIIKFNMISVHENVLNYYKDRMDYINNNFFEEERMNEIKSFKIWVGENKRSDTSIFRSALKLSNDRDLSEKIEFLVRRCILYCSLSKNSVEKILMINEFEEQVKSSLLNEGLFEMLSENKTNKDIIKLKNYSTENIGELNEKKYKEFSKYFDVGWTQEDFENLKKIFNEKESPKIYAIMTCLLVHFRIIFIESRGRKNFYRSWYDFIGKAHPNNERYSSDDFIDSNVKSEFGITFLYQKDSDYLRLQRIFYENFKNLIRS